MHPAWDVQALTFGIFHLMRVWLMTHLTVEYRVIVPPHFWVNVVEVPLETLTLQTLPQCHPLRHISVINAMVLQEYTEPLQSWCLKHSLLCKLLNSDRTTPRFLVGMSQSEFVLWIAGIAGNTNCMHHPVWGAGFSIEPHYTGVWR